MIDYGAINHPSVIEHDLAMFLRHNETDNGLVTGGGGTLPNISEYGIMSIHMWGFT